MKYYKLILVPLAAGFIVFGCVKNKLDQPALGLDESKLANRKGVEGLLIGAYSLLDGIGTSVSGWGSAASNWIYGSVCGSEAYTGSRNTDQPDIRSIEIFSHNALNYYFTTKWVTV